MEIIKTNITPASEYLDNSIEGLGCQIPDCIDRIKDITDGSPEAIKMFLESLSFDEYSEFLNDLNGYFRNKNKDNCYMDGDGLTADGYMPPESEDRIWLMKESFDLAISQESLEKCAYILGMSILTIHPYLDGNGRTSRIMLALLTNGYSGNEDDRRLFSLIGNRDDEDSYHKSNRSVVDADPRGIMFNNGDYSLCDFVLYNMKTKSISNRFGDNADLSNIPIRVGISNRDKSHYLQDSKLTEVEQNRLQLMFGSGPFAYCACLDEMSDETYKKSIRHIEFDGDEYDVISYRKVAKEIEPSEFKRLEDRFKDSRIQYIRAMNSVVNCGFFSDVFRQIVKN